MTRGKSQIKLHQILPLGSPIRERLKQSFVPRLTHGGISIQGKRKTARPFSPKSPTHIVLYSARAKGLWSFTHRKNRSQIQSQIYVYAARFKIHVYRTLTEGNHLHLLVKANERKQLADFLRVLAGRVAISITGAKKHLKRVGKFWDALCWSKLLNFGPEFFEVRQAFLKSELQSKDHSIPLIDVSMTFFSLGTRAPPGG